MITLHLQDSVDIDELVSTLYHQTSVGRPYHMDFGVQEECHWFLCICANVIAVSPYIETSLSARVYTVKTEWLFQPQRGYLSCRAVKTKI